MSALVRHLQGKYAPTLAIALIALVPYILVTSASDLYQKQIGADLGMSKTALSLAASFATAGYAFGALLGGDLINRLRKHWLFLGCEALVALAWASAALAPGPVLYGIGTVLQGFATGMLLVVALPPTVQNFSWKRVPVTAVFINIGLFGAVAAGPLLGGAIAAVHGWRWLYGGFAVVSAIAALFALAIIPDEDPKQPDLRFDWPALLLALGGTFLPFGGVALLSSVGFGAPIVLVPLIVGIACFVALLLIEYHAEEPLAPVEKMWNTLPVIGTLIATFGGGVFVTLMRLTVTWYQKVGHLTPPGTGTMFWPQLAAVCVAAVLLGLVFNTRYLPVLVLVGMLVLCGGGALLLIADGPRNHGLLMIAVALLGFGAGTTVSPGLFLGGFSLPSAVLGRIVALIELVRSVGDFLIAPVMAKLAALFSRPEMIDTAGIHAAVAISVAAAAGTTLLCLLIYATSGLRLPRPDLECWLEKDGTALDSPPLFARWRK